MKLKTRILITFLTVVFLPLIVTAVFLFFFSNYQLNSLKEDYGVEISYENLTNTAMAMSQMTHDTFMLMQEKASSDAGVFEQTNFLETLNERLERVDSFLIVRKGNDIYYNGSGEDCQELIEHLPDYGGFQAESDDGIYIGDDVQALVKQTDFIFSDKSEGSAFIVTFAESFRSQTQLLIIATVIVVLGVLVMTSLALCLWLYRGIVTPLSQLRKATWNIKEGNLDFVVEGNDVEEVNNLCEDFEEMRKRLKESSEENLAFDRESKELISNISHDLKTPITSIKGYVEGIMDGVADTPEKMNRYIQTIYNKAIEMDRLINELTFYSKIDTNRIPYVFNKISVNEYFDDCLDELRMELASENVDFDFENELSDEVLMIADAEQLRRVINNIVSNSLKYMDKDQKRLAIRIKDAGDFIQFEIEDNGMGIERKDLVKIFDRLYRADASRGTSKGGSGIGLSIVKKILEDHGGKVWAASEPGEGTTIYFVLRKYQEVIHE